MSGATFDVFYDPEVETRAWILEHLSEYDGLLLMGTKADKELIDAWNKAYDELVKDGTASELSKKWFGDDIIEK